MKQLLWLTLFLPFLIHGQIQRIGGVPPSLKNFAKIENHLFVLGQFEPYRIHTEEESWQRTEDEFDKPRRSGISKIVTYDTLFFELTNYGGIYKSTDRGISFSRVRSEQREHQGKQDLFYTTDSTCYYYGGEQLWVSKDHGNHFSKLETTANVITAGYLNDYVFYLKRKPDHILFVKSKDNFENSDSTIVPNLLYKAPLKVIVFKDKIILSTHDKKCLYLSSDFGKSWEKRIVGTGISTDNSLELEGGLLDDIASDIKPRPKRHVWVPENAWANEFLADGDTLFLATNQGVYKSADPSLLEWESIVLPDIGYFADLPGITSIVKDNNQLYIVIDNSLIYTLSEKGWVEKMAGLDDGRVLESFTDNNTLYIRNNTQPLFKSTDGGFSFLNGRSKAINQLEHSIGLRYLTFRGIQFAYHSRLQRSEDQGQTWTQPIEGYCRALSLHKDTLWAIVDEGLYLSANEGVSWDLQHDFSAVLTNEYGDKAGLLKGFHKVGEQITIFASRHHVMGSQILYSQDNGKTFEVSRVNTFKSFAANEHTILVYSRDSSNLIISQDTGKTWESITNPCVGNCHMRDMRIQEGLLVLATSKGLFYSINKGMTWEKYYPEVCSDMGFTSIILHKNKWLTTASLGGIFELTHFPFDSSSKD